MTTYRVEALEKFLVRTTYFVDAKDAQQAERQYQDGKVDYETYKIEDGDDEWRETLSVELEEHLPFVAPA